jgi:aconitase B
LDLVWFIKDLKILSQMLKISIQFGKVEFKAPLVVAPPTYNIVDELKAEGDWEVLQNILVLNLMIMLKGVKHTKTSISRAS